MYFQFLPVANCRTSKINLWELPSFQPVYWGLSYNSVWLLVLVLFDCLTLDCVKLNRCVVVFLGLFVIIILAIFALWYSYFIGGDS